MGNNEFKVTAYYLWGMLQNRLLVTAIYKNAWELWNQNPKLFLYHTEINNAKGCYALIDRTLLQQNHWTFFWYEEISNRAP